MNELVLIDEQARVTALDATRSFIVQAPAGSGKTTVLTQRYLKLLASVDEPEQVLAITFTRKAAGEMRERVQRALDARLPLRTAADRVTAELARAVRERGEQRGWGLEESAARLRIQTIDSFNAYLANSLPITSRSAFALRVADDPEQLYTLAARETMQHAERAPEFAADFERVQRRLDNQWMKLQKLLASMLPRRAEWLPNLPVLSGEALVPRVEASLALMVGEALAASAAVLERSLIDTGVALARVAAINLPAEAHSPVLHWRDDARPLSHELQDLPRWRGLARLALTGEGSRRKRLNKNDGIPANDANAKELSARWLAALESLGEQQIAAFASIALLPDPRLPDGERAALDALARLLVLASIMLQRVFMEQGECDYAAVAGFARQALTEESSPTPLAERLGTRLSHILVDEFQDTSREQFDLLRTLTHDWSTGDGRTLFLVGDPMQSIYGFRNAEVGRFASVRDHGLGRVKLEALELRRNFRSAPALVDWCNEIFSKVFPTLDDPRSSAVRHLPSVGARADIDAVAAQLHRLDGRDGPKIEAETIARMVAELRTTRPDESIAILASTRGQLRDVRNALTQRAIAFVGVNLEPLADISMVRDLQALTRALDAPLDRIAWLAVLRGPMVGLLLDDLTRVADLAGERPLIEILAAPLVTLSAEGQARMARAAPILLSAWQERERESWAHRVERVWLALAGPATCSSEAELAHARRFFAALDAAQSQRLRGRTIDLDTLLADLFAIEDSAGSPPVSLMTIHGAKGLEFDHVFIAGVGRRGRGDEARLLNWLELPRPSERDDLLMAPIRDPGDSEEGGEPINSYLSHLHAERARAERARQAYVALTRAKRGLHVFVHPKQRKQDASLYADASSLLHNLMPALGAAIHELPALVGEQPATLEILLAQDRSRLRLPLPPVALPADVMARGELVPLEDDKEEVEFSWARQTARRVGTVVHEALERFARTALPSLDDLPRQKPRLVSRLTALGVEANEAQLGAERALSALQSTLRDTRGRWLFAGSHREAQSELALSGVRGGEIINAVIDRIFVDENGIRWVVDFKTSPHEGGDLEAFLDQEARRYEAQLLRYAHLARMLGPEPVRAGLYFPLLTAWREVPV